MTQGVQAVFNSVSGIVYLLFAKLTLIAGGYGSRRPIGRIHQRPVSSAAYGDYLPISNDGLQLWLAMGFHDSAARLLPFLHAHIDQLEL